MTYLPADVAGRWFYMYLILDVFSRKIVGFEVHDTDDSARTTHLEVAPLVRTVFSWN